MYNRAAGTNALVQGSNGANGLVISGDGKFLAFQSNADNLVAGKNSSNGTYNVFLYDWVAGTTTLVSHNSASTTGTGDNHSYSPVMSAAGNCVAFFSHATNLVGALAARYDVWVDDLTAGKSQVLRNTNVTSVSWIPSAALQVGHKYRWWVQALSANGTAGLWSSPVDFVVL
jgi:hypothetical protein